MVSRAASLSRRTPRCSMCNRGRRATLDRLSSTKCIFENSPKSLKGALERSRYLAASPIKMLGTPKTTSEELGLLSDRPAALLRSLIVGPVADMRGFKIPQNRNSKIIATHRDLITFSHKHFLERLWFIQVFILGYGESKKWCPPEAPFVCKLL